MIYFYDLLSALVTKEISEYEQLWRRIRPRAWQNWFTKRKGWSTYCVNKMVTGSINFLTQVNLKYWISCKLSVESNSCYFDFQFSYDFALVEVEIRWPWDTHGLCLDLKRGGVCALEHWFTKYTQYGFIRNTLIRND